MARVNPFTVGGQDFRTPFTTNLGWMVERRDLNIGQLILAACNYGYNRDGFQQSEQQIIIDGLQAWLSEASEDARQRLLAGKGIGARDDDALVFYQMSMVGIDRALTLKCEEAGPWQKCYIPIRSFRPQRATVEKVDVLNRPFDPQGFNFNRVVDKEAYWQDEFNGVRCAFIYNKFPFASYHSVIVPDINQNLPQKLEGKYHEWLWGLLNQGDIIPGLGIGYNSLGAFASVNHLHFQKVVNRIGFPVSRPEWFHNGGNKPYPTECKFFDDCKRAWAYIEGLDKIPTPYNLLYVKGGVNCYPRFWQHIPQRSSWTTGFAFYELSGIMLTVNLETYNSLTVGEIEAEFAKMWI